MPEHRLPALGQRAEGLQGQRPLGFVHRPHIGAEAEGAFARRVGATGGLRGEHREVLDQLLPPRCFHPGRGHPPDRREQIRPYRLLGPRTSAHRLQRPREHLGRQIVGGVRVPAAGARVPADGAGVAAEQFLVGAVVALPRAPDQLGVGRRQLTARPRYGLEPGTPALRRYGALLRAILGRARSSGRTGRTTGTTRAGRT